MLPIRPTPRAAVAVTVVLAHVAMGLFLVAASTASSERGRSMQRPPVIWVHLAVPTPEPPRSIAVLSHAARATPRALQNAPIPSTPVLRSQPPPAQTAAEQLPLASAVTPAHVSADDAEHHVDPDAQSGSPLAPDVGPDQDAGRQDVAPQSQAVAAVVPPPEPGDALRRTAPDHGVCPPARHPAVLRDRGIEGEVQLRVLVGADGRAREVQVAAPSGWRLFDEAARVQALQCRFVPGTEGGIPMDEWVTYAVVFALTTGAVGHRHAASLR